MSNKKPTAAAPGFSLDAPKLAREPKFEGAAEESLAIRGIAADMQNPKLTAGLSKDEAAEVQRILMGIGSAIPDARQPDASAVAQPPPEPVKAAPAPLPASKTAPVIVAGERIFFTGRLGVGKDYNAAAAQYPVQGFAEPIYQLATHFFGVQVDANNGKDLPGMRVFLQAVGQYGRGEVSATYPYSPVRAMFLTMIRSMAEAGVLPAGTDWKQFGTSDNFWVDALLGRTKDLQRFAITNCRFPNEFDRLKKSGFSHFHCICSSKTWAERLAKKGLTADSPAVKDVSEQMAAQLDAQVIKTLSQQKTGPKLRVIWSDQNVLPPSPRLLTVDEFVNAAKPADLGSLII